MGTGAGCFPEGAMVYTEKGPRDIATIRRGDKVLSASDDGKMIYSEVRRQQEHKVKNTVQTYGTLHISLNLRIQFHFLEADKQRIRNDCF